MKKYNIKLMDNEKGYLNSFTGGLEQDFLFLSFKKEGNGFKTEFTEEEIIKIDKRYLEFKEEV